MKRYAIIESKNQREIVLLQGKGCRYKRCRFCDYYLDTSDDSEKINAEALAQVSGKYGVLEVINSGSFGELSKMTLEKIVQVVKQCRISCVIFECHYLYRQEIAPLKQKFAGVDVKIKLGLESFDVSLREGVMKKGIDESDPALIAQGFDEANLLVGIKGQNKEMIERDLKLGLEYFERICVNVMCDNTKMKADRRVIEEFIKEIYPIYQHHPRIDFLLENTDFGVG